MKKGDKIGPRKDWFVDNSLLGVKFNHDYMIHHVKMGFNALLALTPDSRKTVKCPEHALEMCAIISVLALTGARVSEVLRLKFTDITIETDDDDTAWIIFYMPNIKQKKGSKKVIKKIPIMISKTKEVYFMFEFLDEWYSFVKSQLGEALRAGELTEQDIYEIDFFPTFNRWGVHRYCSKMCRINPHGFRKMYAQYLVVENDIPLKIAQRLLGHRNLNNLEFYINLRTTDLKEGLKKVEQSVESKRDKE